MYGAVDLANDDISRLLERSAALKCGAISTRPNAYFVMAGLVPAIHVFASHAAA